MKNKHLYALGVATLFTGALVMGTSGSLGQGAFGSPTAFCSSKTVFDGGSDDSADFIALMNDLSSGVTCPYSISANAYPVDSHTPMNAHFKCSSSDLEIQYDSSTDDYQIECEKDMGEFTQAVRANLTPQEDGSYTLGVNMDFDADHTDLSFVLNPETLSIEKMTKADY